MGGRFTLVSYEITRTKQQEPRRLPAGVLRLPCLDLAPNKTKKEAEVISTGYILYGDGRFKLVLGS